MFTTMGVALLGVISLAVIFAIGSSARTAEKKQEGDLPYRE